MKIAHFNNGKPLTVPLDRGITDDERQQIADNTLAIANIEGFDFEFERIEIADLSKTVNIHNTRNTAIFSVPTSFENNYPNDTTLLTATLNIEYPDGVVGFAPEWSLRNGAIDGDPTSNASIRVNFNNNTGVASIFEITNRGATQKAIINLKIKRVRCSLPHLLS